MLFISIKNIWGGSQKRQVNIAYSKDLPEEVFQVVLFGKASKSRDVVQANIDHFLHFGSSQSFKKIFGVFLSEAIGADMDFLTIH